MPSPALGLLPPASSGTRFVIFNRGLTTVIANAHTAPRKCFMGSKTPAVVFQTGAELLNCVQHKVTGDINQTTGASPQGADPVTLKLTAPGFAFGPCNHSSR